MLKTAATILFVLCSALSLACDKGPMPTAQASEHTAAAKPAEGTPAAPEKPEADIPGKVYGEPIESNETVAIADILKDPKAFEGKKVRVEGMVTDVCPHRGCWFDMAGKEPGQKLRFKVRDGIMVFPMDAKGKQAVAEGVVAVHTMSLEETQKYMAYLAEEKGEEFDPKSVKEPQTVVRLDGVGAVIRD